MATNNFTRIENTITSTSAINDSVKSLSLAGNNPTLTVDSTAPVNLLLSATDLLQATSAQLIIENETGDAPISLVFVNTAFTDVEQDAAVQRVLGLDIEGATARLNIIRNGPGGSAILGRVGQVLLGAEQKTTTILVEAVDIGVGTENNDYSSVSNIPGPYIAGAGDWLAVITGSTSGAAEATVPDGDTLSNYTQIGNRIFFDISFTNIANNGLTGDVRVSLPAPVAGGTNPSFTIGNIEPFTYTDIAAGCEELTAVATGGNSFLTLQGIVTGLATVVMQADTDFFGATDVTDLQISGSYQIDV